MPYEIFRGTIDHIEDRLSGVLAFGPLPDAGVPVGGKTILLTQPVVDTVTFSGVLNDVLSMTTVIAEINAVAAGTASLRGADPITYPPVRRYIEGQGNVITKQVFLVLQKDSVGVTITGGTALADLRIPTGGISLAPIDPSKIYGFGPDTTSGHYVVLLAP